MHCCERLNILQEAIEDADLRDLLSPVSAVTFGVVPIEKRRDKVLVACGETWHPGCRPFVERLLGLPIETVPFRDSAIRKFVLDGYLTEGTVNHNTFLNGGFLDDPDSLELLTADKVDEIGDVHIALPSDQLVLLDITYVSVLGNLDTGKQRGELYNGPLDVPFQLLEDGSAVAAEEVEDDVAVVMRKDFFYDALEQSGEDSYHGIQALHLNELPYMIHPSEIQLTQVDEDGSLALYVYDHVDRIRPGEIRTWTISYCFLSLGNRHSRRLSVRVNSLAAVDRDRVAQADGPIDWTVGDLDRWFRLSEEAGM